MYSKSHQLYIISNKCHTKDLKIPKGKSEEINRRKGHNTGNLRATLRSLESEDDSCPLSESAVLGSQV